MRLRLDSAAAWKVRDVALKENRSEAEAASVLVSRGYGGLSAAAPAKATDEPPLVQENDRGEMRGAMIGAFVQSRTLFAVQDIARIEGRSISKTIRILLDEALDAREHAAPAA
jgi:hypothetical protein